MNNEIPLGKRDGAYRFFEMVPALVSFGALALVVILSILDPRWAGVYVLGIVGIMLVKAVRAGVHEVRGYRRLEAAEQVDWHQRLLDLGTPQEAAAHTQQGFHADRHLDNLRRIAINPSAYPHPERIHNAVIVAAYNEPYDVIEPTIRSLAESTFDHSRMLVMFAYEERGGASIAATAKRLEREFGSRFAAFELVCHPAHLEGEIAGKGANITFAGRRLQRLLDERGIEYSDVLVTTLDCDNRPHASYFDCIAYEYVVHPDRKRMAYQPISLFLNNIWDAPAPMRVIAAGNSFWNIICSMRPRALRNFASHAQPMDALVEMDFWSRRTIVEDGHQYWRSYFHFHGDYSVLPIHVPIYQDAVLASTLGTTLKAQFKQLARWSYGASDVPFVAVRLFTRNRRVPLLGGLWRFYQLLESHVTLGCVALIIAVGGWVPVFVSLASHRITDFVTHLPFLVGTVQEIAMVGILLMVYLGYVLLPERPSYYSKWRSLGMVFQWVLMPVTSIVYNSASALYSQSLLLAGRYREKFDVTEKATHETILRAAVPEPLQAPAVRVPARF